MADDSWVQATPAVPSGGLALREATALALPAFIASQIVARALVLIIAAHAEVAGPISQQTFVRYYDERTNCALASCVSKFKPLVI